MKMKKRFLSILLSLVIVLGLTPGMSLTAYAETVQTWTSGQCTLTLDNEGNLTVSGTGAMANLNAPQSPWYGQGSNIKSVKIENDVTGICANAFAADSSNTGTNLKQVTISSSVTNIGNYAFQNCAGLTSANIESSTIGYGMFWGCTALSQVTISSNVTKIEQSAFKNCASLTQITIPSSVTEIVYDAFNGCTNLTTVTFTPAAADKTLKLGSNISGSGAKLAYGDGNTKLYDGDTLVEAGASLSDYSSKTLAWKIPVDSYPLWVGGTQVTSENASNIDGSNKASYDAETKTLTLNGYSYNGTGYGDKDNIGIYSAIYAKQDLIIEVTGTNDVKNISATQGSANYYSVFVTGKLEITGNGTLNAKEGIRCRGAITINGGTVNAEVTGEFGSGIDATEDVTIKDCTVTAIGKNNGIRARNGDIFVSGGTVTATGNDGYGIKAETSGSRGRVAIGDSVVVTASGTEGAISAASGVTNAVAGTGWTNKEGTEGKADIVVNTEGQSLTYKKVQFPAAKEPATVTKAPTAKTLTYTGDPQELVNAGEAIGGTMYYAVTTENTAPTDESLYATDIPTATDVGTYYVWYKVVGDGNHSDSKAECITVTVRKALTAAMVKLNADNASVAVKDGEKALTNNTDYTVKESVEVFTITGAGNYTGTVRVAKATGEGSIKVATVVNESAAEMQPSLTDLSEAQEKAVLIKALDADNTLTSQLKDAIKSAIRNDDAAYDYQAVINLNVSSVEENKISTQDKAKINTLISGTPGVVGAYLDLSLFVNYRVTNPSDNNKVLASGTQPITETTDPQSITLTVPGELRPTESNVTRTYSVVRVHGGEAKVLASSTSTTLRFESDRFSTYAITYVDAAKRSGGSSSGGGGALTYPPIIAETANGRVTVSPAAPKAGNKVTVTATPDAGYAVDTVTLTDAKGKAVEVTKNADGTYSFTQPGSRVTVRAAFARSGGEGGEESPQEENCPLDTFSDADKTAWYHDGVHWALENGVMNGMGEGLFAPGGTTSRAMIAQILYNLEGKPVIRSGIPFEDVSENDWYAMAVSWAESGGIIDGYGGGLFGPEDAVTREQLVTILYRYAQTKGLDVSAGEDANIQSYDDAGSVSDWAAAAMRWAVGSGLVNGKTATTLNPQDTATRAEIATIVMRYCENLAK